MTPATLALEAVIDLLAAAGVTASRDAAGFTPAPIGVLVALPERVGGTLGGVTFEIPVLVVSGDPVNTAETVDRLYAEADAIAAALSVDRYRPTTWDGSSRSGDLAAIEIRTTVTVTNESEA